MPLDTDTAISLALLRDALANTSAGLAGVTTALDRARADLALIGEALDGLLTPPEPPPPPPPPPEPTPTIGIWRSPAELMLLATAGVAWTSMLSAARGEWGPAALHDLNSQSDVKTLAGALVAVRLNDAELVARVAASIRTTMDSPLSRTLELARNLVCYVISADLIGFADADWLAWLDGIRYRSLDGKTLIDTHEDRPNNWGTHAGASRVAIARLLGDMGDLDRAAKVFQGWLGNRAAYAGFDYGDLSWQADRSAPVGVNPVGATIEGHDVDGVLPDDQRRGGGFTWPPPKENYAWEALQGAVVQAELLARAGNPAWLWEDRAILRAYTWLHDVCAYPASGDDTGYPWIVNRAYGTNFPAASPAPIGKNMGWADWVFGVEGSSHHANHNHRPLARDRRRRDRHPDRCARMSFTPATTPKRSRIFSDSLARLRSGYWPISTADPILRRLRRRISW